ncbi:YggT family protein [Paraphotobacterium marinum]|uniref:YggT family protein n=1 Tax=Paraphotobacterium marinum TaxID=1755811 RepID=UPI0039EB2328
MQAIIYLINTVFSLYLFVLILKIWLKYVKADYYNPFTQFIVKATNPVIKPLKIFMPDIGKIDTATIVFAYIFCVLKLFIIYSLSGLNSFSPIFLFLGLLSLVKSFGYILFWILILRAILSWFSQGNNPMEYIMYQLTEPLLYPIRKLIPSMGGLDLSVLVLFVILNFLNILIGSFIPVWQVL